MAKSKKKGHTKGTKPRHTKGTQKAKESKGKGKGKGAAPEAAKQAAPKSNPYEVFQNRRRRKEVLGEKVRGERRNLARSRAEAVKDRTRGLLKDSLNQGRQSTFKDGRLGEMGDVPDAKGERNVQRLVKLRQRQTKKSFTLGARGGDQITVGGKPVSGIDDEQLRADGRVEEDDDDYRMDPDDPLSKYKAWKDEQQREAQEQEQALDKLDGDFGDIMGQLDFRPPKAGSLKLPDRGEKDEYDLMMRKLSMERKAIATERVKTPQELARDRADKLEEMERARQARLEANLTVPLDGKAPAKVPELALGSGEAGGAAAGGDSAFIPLGAAALGNMDFSGPREEDADSDEEAEESGDEDGDEGEESEGGEGPEEEEAEEGEVGGDKDEDDLAGEERLTFLSGDAAKVNVMKNGKDEKGLPYAPECHQTALGVQSLLAPYGARTVLKVVRRVMECNAVALAPENRARIKGFYTALLEYILRALARSDGDISARGMEIMYALRTPLLELASAHPEETHAFFSAKLLALGPNSVPRAGEFGLLKLVTLLFPVSDFQHPITTPAAILADHWATNIAALGAGISDLVSDALMLWEVLYAFLAPARRFCSSFFHLGMAILESCIASAEAGREQCAEAAADVVDLLVKSLRDLAAEDAPAARVAVTEIVRPAVKRIAANKACGKAAGAILKRLEGELDKLDAGRLEPLELFKTVAPQIRSLEPVFHEVGDRVGGRNGTEVSESKQLQRTLTKARRTAARKLQRDATVVQQITSRKEAAVRVKRVGERKRVARIMDQEDQMLKQMKTESNGGMDTSLTSYTAKKALKKENKRLGGNTTADTKGAPKEAAKKQPALLRAAAAKRQKKESLK